MGSRGGDGQPGRRWAAGAERTRDAVAGQRLAEYGTNGAGSLSNSRPCGPTFAHRLTGQMAGSEADLVTQGSISEK